MGMLVRNAIGKTSLRDKHLIHAELQISSAIGDLTEDRAEWEGGDLSIWSEFLYIPWPHACLDPNQLHGFPQTALSVLETLTSDPQAYQWPVFRWGEKPIPRRFNHSACVKMGSIALK